MDHLRTIAVGDIHGCGNELATLLGKLEYPRAGDRLIFVGDLFDRGPLPQAVLGMILFHQKHGSEQDYSLESVCGNHDAELLAYCRMLYGEDGTRCPLSSGQQKTVELLEEAGMLEDLAVFLEQLYTIDTIRDEHGQWAVVHAGIDPELGLLETPKETKLTIKALPGSVAWYDEYDGRDGLIICGHQHQPTPLIRSRYGKPVVVNIDTSCCYGGSLTAYIVEEDRFVSVDSVMAYYRERP